MKCQRCPKQATLHITEVLAEEQFEELHLCEECAKKYLFEPSKKTKSSASSVATVDVDPVADLANRKCDECGLTFMEFRNTGRLGCPHDYDCFKEELVPLLESIHGDIKHAGKLPRRLPSVKANETELSQLRKKLQQAIQEEAYETAAGLRDRIRQIEESP